MQIRRGGAADHEWILSLGGSLFEELGDYRDILGHWLQLPRTLALVGEEGAERCGFALVAPRREIGFLWRPWMELVGIGTTEPARRRGIGTLLLDAVVEVALERHAREIRLHTAVNNTAAQAFFGARGFRGEAAGSALYPSGVPARAMVRVLS